MSSQMEKKSSKYHPSQIMERQHIPTSNSHGFETGDFVTYEFSGVADEQIVGLDSGRTYRVVKIQS